MHEYVCKPDEGLNRRPRYSNYYKYSPSAETKRLVAFAPASMSATIDCLTNAPTPHASVSPAIRIVAAYPVVAKHASVWPYNVTHTAREPPTPITRRLISSEPTPRSPTQTSIAIDATQFVLSTGVQIRASNAIRVPRCKEMSNSDTGMHRGEPQFR